MRSKWTVLAGAAVIGCLALAVILGGGEGPRPEAGPAQRPVTSAASPGDGAAAGRKDQPAAGGTAAAAPGAPMAGAPPVQEGPADAGEAPPRMPPDMAREVWKHARTDHAGLRAQPGANGAVFVDLQGRFQSVPVAYRDKDGNIRIVEEQGSPDAGPSR